MENQQALDMWRGALSEIVRRKRSDLSTRQMAVLLTVYLAPGPHTVRGLSARLAVSKPAITRALDRLGDLDLIRRKEDESDRRSVLIQRTVKGSVFLSEFGELISLAASKTGNDAAPDDAGTAEPTRIAAEG